MEMLAQILQNQTELKLELKQEIHQLVGKLEMRIENEVIEKIRGLYDDRQVQSETTLNIMSTLNRMEAKLDVLQLETAHIRRVK
jgi:hypothetical protein